jgi:hypothetical protein
VEPFVTQPFGERISDGNITAENLVGHTAIHSRESKRMLDRHETVANVR